MDYICFIDREGGDVPFMDILQADSLADACDFARILMSQRSDSAGARLFVGDDLVGTLPSFWKPVES